MKKIYLRRIILLSCIAVLLCIYIVQLLLSGRSGIKTKNLESAVDAITIESAASAVHLIKKDDKWFVSEGEGKTLYEASQGIADNLLSEVKDIKILATATKSVGSDSARYGLDDASKIVVTAYNASNAIRTVYVGKATSTNSQNYIQLDNDQAVYIVGSSLHSDFSKSCDDIRSKSIFSLGDDEKIEKISCVYHEYADDAESSEGSNAATTGSNSGDYEKLISFSLEKLASQADTAASDSISKDNWKLTSGTLEEGKELDNDKVVTWISSLSNLSASSWLPDNAKITEGYRLTEELSFTAAGKIYTAKLYTGKEGEQDSYIMSSSETPYLFKAASYIATRYSKKLSDLSK